MTNMTWTSWDVVLGLVVAAMLVTGWIMGRHLIGKGQPFENSLRAIVAVIGLPAFVFLAGTDKISAELRGALIFTIVGFALGRAIKSRSN